LRDDSNIRVVHSGRPLSQSNEGRQLLDVAELNAGASFSVPPSPTPGQPGNLVRILDLHADSKEGRVITVTMSQQPVTTGNFTSGPVRGIIEFGNGGAISTVEFDIPPPDCLGSFTQPGILSLFFKNSGVSLSVPAGSLRVYARNDANAGFIQVPLPNVIGSLAGDTPNVFAHASYNAVFGAVAPTRTVYLAPPQGVPFPNTSTLVCDVPPFATAVRFMRGPIPGLFVVPPLVPSPQINVALCTPWGYASTYQVPAGEDGYRQFSADVNVVSVENTSGGPINGVAAVFDIGNF
jgi:hypothetical protein